MEIEEAFKDVMITAVILSLIPAGYFLYKATKKMKVGLFGHLAIGVDSLITGNPEKIRELKATIKNKVKKTDPQDFS